VGEKEKLKRVKNDSYMFRGVLGGSFLVVLISGKA